VDPSPGLSEFLMNASINVKWREAGNSKWCVGQIIEFVPGPKHPLCLVQWTEDGTDTVLDLFSSPPELNWKITDHWNEYAKGLAADPVDGKPHPLSAKFEQVRALCGAATPASVQKPNFRTIIKNLSPDDAGAAEGASPDYKPSKASFERKRHDGVKTRTGHVLNQPKGESTPELAQATMAEVFPDVPAASSAAFIGDGSSEDPLIEPKFEPIFVAMPVEGADPGALSAPIASNRDPAVGQKRPFPVGPPPSPERVGPPSKKPRLEFGPAAHQ